LQVNDYQVILNLPDITFSIDPELANEINQCRADITVQGGDTEPVTCIIVTESDQNISLGSGVIIANGFDQSVNVTAGTRYRLECDITDSIYGEIINQTGLLSDRLSTLFDRCVANPNLRQN